MTYLDTHVAVWLSSGQLSRISEAAREQIESDDLLVSPMLVLELQYLYEIGRVSVCAPDIIRKLEFELDIQVCTLEFPQIMSTAVHESWTRDAFDRVIVAHAKTNGLAYLVSADERIRAHYPRTIW